MDGSCSRGEICSFKHNDDKKGKGKSKGASKQEEKIEIVVEAVSAQPVLDLAMTLLQEYRTAPHEVQDFRKGKQASFLQRRSRTV